MECFCYNYLCFTIVLRNLRGCPIPIKYFFLQTKKKANNSTVIHDTFYRGLSEPTLRQVRRAGSTTGYVLQDKRGIRKISREHNFSAGDVTQPTAEHGSLCVPRRS